MLKLKHDTDALFLYSKIEKGCHSATCSSLHSHRLYQRAQKVGQTVCADVMLHSAAQIWVPMLLFCHSDICQYFPINFDGLVVHYNNRIIWNKHHFYPMHTPWHDSHKKKFGVEMWCITSSCPVICLNGINGERAIHNALLLLLSVAYVISVSQFHFHFPTPMLDYFQLLIMVRWFYYRFFFFAALIKIQFKISHYADMK